MRIIISGPPKQGHRWLRCLLGSIYDLQQIGGSQTPEMRARPFRDWAAAGGFPDESMFHQHGRFSHRLCDEIDAVPAHVVTPVRDPYDTFVSLYYWSQEKAAAEAAKGTPKDRSRDAVVGKSLDDPDVLEFLENGFSSHLYKANQWFHSGRGVVIRYEGLHSDPVNELKRATDLMRPVPIERIEQAIEHCKAENMRQRSAHLAKHVRSAKVGDSKERLNEQHLAIFRERHAEMIRGLGYDVRGDANGQSPLLAVPVAVLPIIEKPRRRKRDRSEGERRRRRDRDRPADEQPRRRDRERPAADRPRRRARERAAARSAASIEDTSSDLRIVITSPPKTGNKWLKCLLSSIYDLETLKGDDTPDVNPAKFRAWVEAGNFGGGQIFHQHCRFSRRLADAIAAVPAHGVTIIRDPYDQFVSLYYWLQTRAEFDATRGKVRSKQRPRDLLIGRPIDDPAVLDYLRTDFQTYLVQANEWLHGGRSVVFRYESLHRDPMAELQRGTAAIQPVDEERIAAAIASCSVESMRQQSDKMASHIRTATVGDSRQRLSDAHLQIFREQYAELIESLGYEVR